MSDRLKSACCFYVKFDIQQEMKDALEKADAEKKAEIVLEIGGKQYWLSESEFQAAMENAFGDDSSR